MQVCVVTVCFVDIRGFSKFTEDTGHNAVEAIRLLFDCLNDALQHAITNVSQCLAEDTPVEAFHPTCCKTEGDGAMIVWEQYQGPDQAEMQNLLSRCVLDFASYLQAAFVLRMRGLGKKQLLDSNGRLGLGMGFSSGLAWRIVGRADGETDYMGRPLNQASRLMASARPFGAFFDLHIDADLFMERYCLGEGKIEQIELRGIPKPLPVWSIISESADYKICTRRCREGTLGSAALSLQPLASFNPLEPIPLGKHDLKTIFDEREYWEAEFTCNMAQLVADGNIPSRTIKELGVILDKMEKLLVADSLPNDQAAEWGRLGVLFHSQIAKYSSPDKAEGLRRAEYTQKVYQTTRKIYIEATEDYTHRKIADEHREILELVKAGAPDRVRQRMNDHLSSHYDRAREYLLTSANRFPPREGQ